MTQSNPKSQSEVRWHAEPSRRPWCGRQVPTDAKSIYTQHINISSYILVVVVRVSPQIDRYVYRHTHDVATCIHIEMHANVTISLFKVQWNAANDFHGIIISVRQHHNINHLVINNLSSAERNPSIIGNAFASIFLHLIVTTVIIILLRVYYIFSESVWISWEWAICSHSTCRKLDMF